MSSTEIKLPVYLKRFVDLVGCIWSTLECAPIMVEQETGGSIVNISFWEANQAVTSSFLCFDEAQFITGMEFILDGGASLQKKGSDPGMVKIKAAKAVRKPKEEERAYSQVAFSCPITCCTQLTVTPFPSQTAYQGNENNSKRRNFPWRKLTLRKRKIGCLSSAF